MSPNRSNQDYQAGVQDAIRSIESLRAILDEQLHGQESIGYNQSYTKIKYGIEVLTGLLQVINEKFVIVAITQADGAGE